MKGHTNTYRSPGSELQLLIVSVVFSTKIFSEDDN